MERKFKVSIILTGIRKKQRKEKRHCLPIGYVEWNNGLYDENSISDKVKTFIQENMKTVNSEIKVHLDMITITDIFEQWLPFSSDNKQFTLKSSLERALA